MSLNKTTIKRESDEVEKINTSELPSLMDLSQDLFNHAYALKALRTLMQTSGLSFFADEELDQLLQPTRNENASNMRWGLSQLIDLYLEKQERIVSEFAEKYEKNDYVILKGFENSIRVCKEGMFERSGAINHLENTMKEIEPIIENSSEFRDRAEKAKQEALDFIAMLRGKGSVKYA